LVGDSGISRAAAIAYPRHGADVAINYLLAKKSDAPKVIALLHVEKRKGLP